MVYNRKISSSRSSNDGGVPLLFSICCRCDATPLNTFDAWLLGILQQWMEGLLFTRPETLQCITYCQELRVLFRAHQHSKEGGPRQMQTASIRLVYSSALLNRDANCEQRCVSILNFTSFYFSHTRDSFFKYTHSFQFILYECYSIPSIPFLF